MQMVRHDINDLFSGTGSYPLESFNKANRWVVIADALDWNDIEVRYNQRLGNQKHGAGNKPARMVIGALIVKHSLKLSDEQTIMTIQENPYMQYLVGLMYFQEKPIFSPELFVTIRKRIDEEFFNEIMLSMQKQSQQEEHEDDNQSGSPAESSDDTTSGSEEVPHKGTMKIDATCTDAEVRFPTDVNLLEDASREIARQEKKLCKNFNLKTPTSCRAEARSCYVRYIKHKTKGWKITRTTKELLLHLLSKDIQYFMKFIGGLTTDMLNLFNRTDVRNFASLRTVYAQQKEMFDNKTRSCADRIVSIFQPHIRPIVRSKARHKTEFGAKIGVSVVDGITYIDHLSWDAYNESSDLSLQLETYKSRFGCYPKEVQADKIYLNKENRKLLASLNIECHCPALGRPPKNPDTEKEALRRKASGERNGVEATFGTAKRVYGANDIRAKLPETSRTWIGACFFVKNLKKFMTGLLCAFFRVLFNFRKFTHEYVKIFIYQPQWTAYAVLVS